METVKYSNHPVCNWINDIYELTAIQEDSVNLKTQNGDSIWRKHNFSDYNIPQKLRDEKTVDAAIDTMKNELAEWIRGKITGNQLGIHKSFEFEYRFKNNSFLGFGTTYVRTFIVTGDGYDFQIMSRISTLNSDRDANEYLPIEF